MILGRVVGRLWASRQAAGLAGRKLLLVRPETEAGGEADRLVVAVDGLAAGREEAESREARGGRGEGGREAREERQGQEIGGGGQGRARALEGQQAVTKA